MSVRLYFAYGSNLSLFQMSQRCPSSTFVGVAHLPNFRWHINERGYASVTPSALHSVYGMVYNLTTEDEASLDVFENVPRSYTKETHLARVCGTKSEEKGILKEGTDVQVLLYIDRLRSANGAPREEYIGRMERAVKDAIDNHINLTDGELSPSSGSLAKLARRFPSKEEITSSSLVGAFLFSFTDVEGLPFLQNSNRCDSYEAFHLRGDNKDLTSPHQRPN
ncbi:hypothetical protein PROFUN_12406 [Planoprotostelium fungivorum]|uniref:gamma-glutamylcyclotransferase n=1 Tax=Planoprotostelium fungivorum TaxID=1890364 RepID=A0A2P6N7K7_9EUKA|nr:hypothetical protein PROFUN_12406 [Planoprotostelium fungivorum]